MWLTPRDWAILKAWRKKPSSEGKSSPSPRTPASKGRSVADCYDQPPPVECSSSKDPAMANAVETPSASRNSGESGIMQRAEARSHRRNDVPMTRGKAYDNVGGPSQQHTGDSSHKKGGTQEFLTFHSQCVRLG